MRYFKKVLLPVFLKSAPFRQAYDIHAYAVKFRMYPDRLTPDPKYNGIYQTILAMKYLRPSDEQWSAFADQLTALISKYSAVIEMGRLNFPQDWHDHFAI